MPKTSIHICAVIPTYNNAGTICDVVRRTLEQIRDVIVVVDGSTDDTLARLQEADLPITLVSYARNRGKGGALKQGFAKAQELGFDYVLTLDGDGQHFPEDIPLLVEEEERHPGSLIVGSRELRQANMPGKNTFANKFSNFWFAIQTGRYLPDTQTGMRIYPLSKLKGLRWLTSRYEAELELLVFSAWAGIRLLPVPIRVYYPPKEERVSHFRPAYDFARISLLNTVLCVLALVYGLPKRWGKSLLFVSRLTLLTLFVATPYLLLVRLLAPDTARVRLHIHTFIYRLVRHLVYTINGCHFSVLGEQFRPNPDQPHMYIANHQSLLDVWIVMALQPKMIVLTKDWVRRSPLFGAIARCAGFLAMSEDMDMLHQHLKPYVDEGYSVIIFPEGTRTATGEVAHFHKGAFQLAEMLQIPIQPMVIHNTYHMLNRVEFRLYSAHFALEYLPAINSDDSSFGAGARHRTRSMEAHYTHLLKRYEPERALVIGAGVGGLFTAALLAKEGKLVTVVEQLPVAGGGMYSYTRIGEVWQTGLHVACGMGEGELIHDVLQELGISVPVEKCGPDVVHGTADHSHLSILYGGDAPENAFARDMITRLYAEGCYRFVGGTRALTDALCLYITRHGGRVLLGERVTKILLSQRRAQEVQTTHYHLDVSRDIVVSTLHPKMLLEVCSEAPFRPATCKRIRATKESYGSFKLYLKFKPHSLPYDKSNHYLLPDNIFCYMQPVLEQDEWAHTMEVVAPLDYAVLQEWSVGRKDDYAPYEAYKQQEAERLIGRVETMFPTIRACIDDMFTSTSLTYRDIYLTPEGAMYGMSESLGRLKTDADNLYLSGQNCRVHGFYGTVKTSVAVVNEIMGRHE